MDVSGALHTLRKHWILTSVLVLLTLVAAMEAWVKIPGPYQSSSQVVFLASQQASKPNGSNPYLSFADTLGTTADIVRREVLDPRVVAALAARGFTEAYDIQDDPLGTGPVLDITATGHTQAGATATQAAVTADVQTALTQLQSDILPKNQITSMVVTSTPEPKLLVSKKARPVVAVLVLGFILTLAIPQMVDAIQSRGRNRRKKGNQRPWARIATPTRAAPASAAPASAFPSSDGSKPSQLTPTVGQRTETNGRVEPEAGNRHEVASGGIDF
jgi:capsular polysaccharide biosynthesis protein